MFVLTFMSLFFASHEKGMELAMRTLSSHCTLTINSLNEMTVEADTLTMKDYNALDKLSSRYKIRFK